MIHEIHSNFVASISDLKKNPMLTISQGNGEPVAILNHNEPVFYCIPADVYEHYIELMENQMLTKVIKERENSQEILINIDDL